MINRLFIVLCTLLLSSGCTILNSKPSEVTTIKSIKDNVITIEQKPITDANYNKTISAYKTVMARTEKGSPYYIEALRRLADIEMERADDLITSLNSANLQSEETIYKQVIAHYEELLKTYPDMPAKDRVLYQLAKAYEHNGQLDNTLKTFDTLIKDYPDSPYLGKKAGVPELSFGREQKRKTTSKYLGEVQFRRGEINFTRQSYAAAETAYAAVARLGDKTKFYERAIYKHGWSLYKQGKYPTALNSLFTLLDIKFNAKNASWKQTRDLQSSEKEFRNDTLRVLSLSLSNMDGAYSLSEFFTQNKRNYEPIIYDYLGQFYLERGHIDEATDTFLTFIEQHPEHSQAPFFYLRAIFAYNQANQIQRALNAKQEFIKRFGVKSKYWASITPVLRKKLTPYLVSTMSDLAHHYHAQYQKDTTQNYVSYTKAVNWYHQLLTTFPKSIDAPNINFMLAEILFENRSYKEAAIEYEKTAYDYPKHKQSNKAAYAALTAYKQLLKQPNISNYTELEQQMIDSSLRFTKAFPNDSRTPAVLVNSAQKLFEQKNNKRATIIAKRILALDKQSIDAKIERTAWAIIAHTNFEQQNYIEAEEAYKNTLKLTPFMHPDRNSWQEKLAASIYKQGEWLQNRGETESAVESYLRVKKEAPASAIAAVATYDAAALLITMQRWDQASNVLEYFITEFPRHKLQPNALARLSETYIKNKQPTKAAGIYETLSTKEQNPDIRREAAWKAAELYDKGQKPLQAINAYKRYITFHPFPVPQAMEARHRLSLLYQQQGDYKKQQYWLEDIVNTERGTASFNKTDRVRYITAKASLALARPQSVLFHKIKLVKPFKKNLKQKKKKMTAALNAYKQAITYNVADIVTESTYRIAEIYNEFAHALMTSERPSNLSPEELEQYEILLEEEAYPFEEKAIDTHTINAKRTQSKIYDQWVKRSIKELSKLSPARYNKQEKGESYISSLE